MEPSDLAVRHPSTSPQRSPVDASYQRDARSHVIVPPPAWWWDACPDVFWAADSAGRLTSISSSCVTMYGQTPDQFVGRAVWDLAIDVRVSEDRAAFNATLDGRPLKGYRTVHGRRSGESVTVELWAAPVRDADGRVIGVAGGCRDLTDLASQRRAIEAATREVEVRRMGGADFLVNLCNHIRTPVNEILGTLEVLRDTSLDQEQRQATDLLQTSSRSLVGTINDLLDFGKIESGELGLTSVVFELPSLAQSVVNIINQRTRRSRVTLSCDVGTGVPRLVNGDPGRLRQVLTHLLDNAVRFTDAGSVDLVVRVMDGEGDVAKVSFAVSDTGMGISDDRLTSIFAGYKRTAPDALGNRRGIGLGLPVSHRLVQTMGGILRVDSTLGKGSTFEFTVPFVTEEPTATNPVEGMIDGIRVMVVASAGASRSVVADLMRNVGVDAHQVESIEYGLEEVRSTTVPYDVVVIDCLVPDDGFHFAEAYLEIEVAHRAQILILTSSGNRGDAQRCRELSVAGYLTKPISRPQFFESLVAVVGRKDAAGLVTRHSIEETRQPRSVLLIEDELVNQTIGAAMLRRRGHCVDVVVDLRDAAKAAADTSYDAVLIDLTHPVLDGPAALIALRSVPGGESLPLIACVSQTTPKDRVVLGEWGFDSFLPKPYRPHELFAAVEGWGLRPENADRERAETRDRRPVDLDSLRQVMAEAGVADAVDSLVQVFADDAPKRLRMVEQAVEKGHAASIETAAHMFRSAAVTIRASDLAKILGRLESAGRSEDLRDVESMVTSLRNEVVAVQAQLSQIA